MGLEMDPALRLTPPRNTLRLQAFYQRVLYVVAPATVAAMMILLRQEDAAQAAAVFVTLVASGLLLWPDGTPMHLMPVASTALRLLAPIAGMALVVSPGLVSPAWELAPADVVAPLIGALLIVVMARFLETRFNTGSPVRLALIAPQELASKLDHELRASRIHNFRLVGYITAAEPFDDELGGEEEMHWLGTLDDIRRIVQEHGVDLLAIGGGSPRLHVFEETAKACLDLRVAMVEVNAFYENVLGHVPIGSINSAWFQCIMHPNYAPTSPLIKRAVDLAITIPVGLLVGLPLLCLFALAIKLSDRGPVFFHQRRVGEQGREFDMLKFRTFHPNADELMLQGVPEAELVTSVGRFLRTTHMNELPQLINVVRGNMTIVGPRPEPPSVVESLEHIVPYYQRRGLVKPGLTGWAQVRCGYAGDPRGSAWKMCHDLFYVKQQSVAFDLLIMLQTLQVLVEMPADVYEGPHEEFTLGEAASPATHASQSLSVDQPEEPVSAVRVGSPAGAAPSSGGDGPCSSSGVHSTSRKKAIAAARMSTTPVPATA